ncbi:unnamed protein product [Arctogadus glacialis]
MLGMGKAIAPYRWQEARNVTDVTSFAKREVITTPSKAYIWADTPTDVHHVTTTASPLHQMDHAKRPNKRKQDTHEYNLFPIISQTYLLHCLHS